MKRRALFIIFVLIISLNPFSRGLYAQEQETDKIKELDDFIRDMNILKFNSSDWKRIRNEKEAGIFRVEEEVVETGEVTEEGIQLKPAVPKSGGLIEIIDLPGAQLQITGREEIQLGLKYSDYPNDETRYTNVMPDMKQRTQVKIQGKVGERIKVDVDFDTEDENKQDISIVYKGLPDDIIQEAAFGDVTLSLPGSEFVSYRGSKKSLFGGKVSGQYKKLKFMAIGSQSKGIPEVKKFTGQSTFVKKELNDYSYIRRKYYKIYESTVTIPQSMSEAEIYIDDKDVNNNNPVPGIDYEMTVDLPAGLPGGTTSYTGFFNKQVPGIDYYINYREGIITFKKTIRDNYIIAVAYKHSGGAVGYDPVKKMVIKWDTESAWNNNELKDYYSFGATKISRGVEGRDFIVQIWDSSKVDITTNTIGNIYDKIEMDYDAGILRFVDEKFFVKYSTNPGIYQEASSSVLAKSHKNFIHYEFFHKKKTYNLRFNMLEGSERVLFDGRQLEKGKDYMIEYNSGFITFFNEDEITDDTQIEISYEYSPWGGQINKTLLGLWGEYKPSNKFSVKGTVISDGSPAPLDMPDLGSAPASTQIYDINSSITLDNEKFPLKTTISGEFAYSSNNPNVFGKASIDNMEGIKLTDSISMHEDSWRIARNPDLSSVSASDTLTWDSDVERQWLTVIDSESYKDSRNNSRVQILEIDHKLGADEQASMVYSISKSGVDYSRKANLECYIYGNNGGEEIRFRLGNIDEDADGDGNLDTEDFGISRSSTNDVGENDGLLSKHEDIGWDFDGWAGVYNAQDRLDTEDIDSDGILDPDLNDGGEVVVSSVSWTGWRKISYSLNVSSATDWNNIRHMRMTITGAGAAGSLKMTELKTVGNRWEKGVVVSTGTLVVDAINNEDNYDEYADYALVSNTTTITVDGASKQIYKYYNQLYRDFNQYLGVRKEQALSLNYSNLAAGATAYTLSKLNSGDFTGHEKIRFFVYSVDGSSASGTFFMQFGSDNAYYSYRIDMNWTGWKMIEIEMVDNVGGYELKPTKFKSEEGDCGKIGNPSFLSISQIKMGIYNGTGAILDGEVWINEIHLSDSRARTGTATRYTVNTSIPGWFSISYTDKHKGNDFQNVTAPSTRQSTENKSFNGKFSRLKILPLGFNWNRSIVTTPKESFIQGETENYVSSYEEGIVKRINWGLTGGFNVSKLPNLNYSYTDSLANYTETRRTDTNESHKLSGSYKLPIRFFPIPIFKLHKLFNFLPESISYNYGLTNRQTYDKDIIEYQKKTLEEKNRNYSLNVKYEPIKKIPISGSYSFSQKKQYNPISDKSSLRLQEESINLSTSIKLFNWFQPNIKYLIKNKEDYIIPSDGSETLLKDISRTSTGEASLRLKAASVVKAVPLLGRIKLFSSLVSDLSGGGTYRFNDGDIYKDIRSTYTFFTNYDNVVNVPRIAPIRNVWKNQGEWEFFHREDIEGGGRLKSYGMQDTITLDASGTPLSFIDIGKGMSFITGFKWRWKYNTLTNNRQEEGTLSEKQNTNWSHEVTLRNMEEFPLIKWIPILGKQIKNTQAIVKISNKTDETMGISISTSTTVSIDGRFKLWIFDIWLKYTNVNSGTLKGLTREIMGNNDTYNANLNFRVFNNIQFVMKFSVNKTKQYKVNVNTQDNDTVNFGIDMNTSIQPSKLGLKIPGTARIRGTLLNLVIRDDRINERNISRTLSLLDMTVEYDQGTNLLLSFGIDSKLYYRPDVSEGVGNEENSVAFGAWAKLTFQF